MDAGSHPSAHEGEAAARRITLSEMLIVEVASDKVRVFGVLGCSCEANRLIVWKAMFGFSATSLLIWSDITVNVFFSQGSIHGNHVGGDCLGHAEVICDVSATSGEE